MSYTLPKPVDYSRSGYTLYTAAGNLKASVVMIGASVDWGYGLDQTQTYAYLMQKTIDTHVGRSMGGWVPRYIHTDDLMSGGKVVSPYTAPTYYPYNGTSAASGWSAGINDPTSYSADSYGTPVPFAPTITASPFTNPGRSKLNWNAFSGQQPRQADAGIFGGRTYSGDKNATWTNGGVVLDSSHVGSLRWAVNFPTSSTCYVFFRITEIAGSTINLTLRGTPDNGSTFWTISSGGAISIGANSSAWYYCTITTSSAAASPIQQMLLDYSSGSGQALIEVLCPLAGVQKSNHLLVQVCSRNSYCLQDYASVNTYPTLAGGTPVSDPGSGVGQRYTTDTVGRTAVRQIVDGVCNIHDGSTIAYPFYILGETYNSIISQWQNAGTWYDKRLTPTQYGNQLDLIGKDLIATTGGGQIILTMPIRAQTALTLAGAAYSVTPGWSGYGMRATSSGSTYCWEDYWQAIYNLAAARGWGFVDQGQIDCISHTGNYYSDCPNLYAPWTDPGGQFYQNDGLHPGSGTSTATTTIAQAFISQLGLDGGH